MDAWDAGDLYEQYMGRWSRRIAHAYVGWLDAEPGSRWLDVGCGTGALTSQILAAARPTTVTGIDPSEAFVTVARAGVPGASFDIGTATSLPYPDRSFDMCVSALALNFVPDPGTAIRDMARVTVAGGVVSGYVWDYAGGMEMLRRFWDVAVELDAAALELDEARRFPLCVEGALADAFAAAGLSHVEATPLTARTTFGSFEDFWSPFLGGQGPAPTYVASLGPRDRAALESGLRARVPADGSGRIEMSAKAWAVRGRVAD